MARKTFRIGEYAIGGIITATITSKQVDIVARDWSTGKTVAALQVDVVKNCPWGGTIERQYSDLLATLDIALCGWTSSYYAGKVIDWIKDYLKHAIK